MNNTTTHTTYYPRIKGQSGYFCPSGFSKIGTEYNIYDHIKELRDSIYEGKKQYETAEFEIVAVTTVTTVIPVSTPSPVELPEQEAICLDGISPNVVNRILGMLVGAGFTRSPAGTDDKYLSVNFKHSIYFFHGENKYYPELTIKRKSEIASEVGEWLNYRISKLTDQYVNNL